METEQPLPSYTAELFANPPEECDIVLKGGVTSGLVYPYAVLELATRYRFRSIGGTSAGAIAAALAAAAEYARTHRDDPSGFVRLQKHCDKLPQMLPNLFQARRRYRPLFAFLMRAQRGGGMLSLLLTIPAIAPLAAGAGALVGGLLLWLLNGGIAGTVLGALVGCIASIAFRLIRLVRHELPGSDFGLCPGLDQPGGQGPALTRWLHEALQDVAFGPDAPSTPALSFGDLRGTAADRQIDLRVVTTNLGMGRPHTLPVLGITAAYSEEEWRDLFPSAVCDQMAASATDVAHMPGLLAFPSPDQLPVIVAARMSLAFPLLFSAVPVHVRDFAGAELRRATGAQPVIENRRILFADGGISSNFPIHLFDALLPERPTFALSLDDLPGDDALGPERVFIPSTARHGFGLPSGEVHSVSAFLGAALIAAKDWQDQLLSTMPGQRERIARVLLGPGEGGFNLTMSPELARSLMQRGLEVGRRFAGGELNFDEHRWRRSLVAYEQLERTVAEFHRTWMHGFGAWLASYLTQVDSYKRLSRAERHEIHKRLDAVAALHQNFEPPIADQTGKLPRPTGVLRVNPRY
ncbi:patatin-like phospholipase family protein [Sphingomonas xinjiangensis]|uniref:Putative acylesterase/phospholipase RssA n=1 Tax=Sphingomonas xinjiangensis TaxID=643568 RepID=A0A840YS73_9SPHN|nr:putative acylesterase/phospholipase RssA [Sphingomonas xinjiangensis]